jgi:AraC-like DNA-binding protein
VLIDPHAFRKLCRARDRLASDDATSVRALAVELHISPYHFIRLFDAVFGVTPHQFRTRARLEHARDLLAAGAPVTDVCLEVGYASLGSFSALFTRWVGASPSAYRRARITLPAPPPPRVPGCLGMLATLPPAAFRNSREARLG